MEIRIRVDNTAILEEMLKAKAKYYNYDYEAIKHDQNIIRFLLIDIKNDFSKNSVI